MKRIMMLLISLLLLAAAAGAEATAEGSAGAIRTESSLPSGLPVLFFTGDPVLMTKYNAVPLKVDFFYDDQAFHGYAAVKWQGTSSIAYPKKNYTIKLYEDEALTIPAPLDVGWGGQTKYCLKANYIDHTHARNIVSARLWGDVVRSRESYAALPEEMRNAPNVGAIDGFPIKVYFNGSYVGLYTWNIPKDAWMFGMDEALDQHTALCSENYGSGCFREEALIDGSDWSDEIHDEVPESILARWNEVVAFVRNAPDTVFVSQIDHYIDKESLIDYYIFAYLTCGLDSMGKNQIYCTYDGVKWYASMYDMDSTWGLHYSGEQFVSPEYRCQEDYESNSGDHPGNLLYERVAELFPEEIAARYAVLREGPLSDACILHRFDEFFSVIPEELFAKDLVAYPEIPSAEKSNFTQIMAFLRERGPYVDFMMAHLGEEAVYRKPEADTPLYSRDGVDAIGAYAFRLEQPLVRSSFILDTGFMPYDTEKDWTIYCRFADSMVAEDGVTASIFEMREPFPEAKTQTAVYLRRVIKDEVLTYQFAGGFGGFDFPFYYAPDYEVPADGYHEVVIIKEGGKYRFYLDGYLAYNCPLDYPVEEAYLSRQTLHLFGRVEDGTVMNRAFGEIADFRIYTSAIPYSTFAALEHLDYDGTDAFGSYALKTRHRLNYAGEAFNTGYLPFNEEKDWTIFCKFNDDNVLEDEGTCAIFSMRQFFDDVQKHTAVYLHREQTEDEVKYAFGGGFGGFQFQPEKAAGYVPSTDGYHYAVIVKQGDQYRFYLDGGLAYGVPLGYGVAPEQYSTWPLYLFGQVENGHEYNHFPGQVADFRIYTAPMDEATIERVLADMK